MKKDKFIFCLVLLFAIDFFCCTVKAQEKEKVRIRIHYITKFLLYEEQETEQEDETILDIGNKISHFYSRNSLHRDLIKDSIVAKGGSMGDVMNALEKSNYPKTNFHYQIWKNYPSDKILTHTDKAINIFRYSEKMNRPEWTLIAKDTIIANYKCQQAETLYLGRHWKVWFTLDIAISDGPWKLYGLPGLILHAEDSERLFRFSCIQIEKIQNEFLFYPSKRYIPCTKEEYHDLIRLKWKSPMTFAERMSGFKGSAQNQRGKSIAYPERTALFLER